MQERTIAIDSDGSSITLRYDDRGFLVGDALDLGKTQKELESISGDVQAIRAFLMGSASRNLTESTATVSPSINSARRTSEKAAKKLLEAAKKLSRAADEVGNGSTRQSGERIASENRERERARRESARRQSQEITPLPIQSDGNERIPPPRAASERRATEAAGDLARAVSEANERERRTRRVRPSESSGNSGNGGRDANGRFLPGSRGANSIADSIKDGVGNGLKGIFAEIGNVDSSRIDPAIEATKEALAPVAMIAKPLGRASLAVGRIGLKGAVGTAKLIGRGFSSRGTDNWLKRLWNESRLSRRDSNLWNERRLREMRNRRGEGDGRGGLLGLIAMLLPLFAGFIAMLTGLFSKFFSMTGLAGLLGKILPGALARRIAGGLGGGRDRGGNSGGDGRDSRRNRRGRNPPTGDDGANPPVPPGGDNGRRRGGRMRGMRGLGWLAAGAALFGAASVEADDSLTREEKNQEHGASAGVVANGAAGALAGAAIGTMIFPGVGTVIGGLIGGFAADYFAGDAAADLGAKFTAWVSNTPLSAMPGQIVDKFKGWTDSLINSSVGQAVIGKVGEWTQTLKDSEIGKHITEGWDTLTADISSKWDTFSKTLTETWDGLKKGTQKALDTANDYIKEKTGIDVKGGIDAAGTAIGNGAAAVGQWFKDNISPWVQSLVDSDIGKFVKDKWESLTGDIKSTWDSFSKTLTDTWENIKKGTQKALEGVNGWFKDKAGIDVGAGITAAGAAISNGAAAIGDAASSAWDGAKDSATSAKNWATGTTKERQGVLLRAAKTAGITDTKELANFMGQTDHETGGFKRMEENLNYSAKGLLKQFKGRNGINTLEDAQKVVNGGKESIANAVYGGEWGKKNLGNTEAGDGFKYRGRGFKQLTGKSNYEQATKELGIDLVNNPDLAFDNDIAAKIATWYWKKRVPDSAKGDVTAATKAINGGTNGLDDRIKKAGEWESIIASGEADKIATSGQVGGAPLGAIASAASAMAGAVDLAKSIPEKYADWKDGNKPISEHVKQMRIKDSQGNTKTVGEMGITTYGELKSKGGQAFEGGDNDPTATYATSLIQKGFGENFWRVTAQNDLYHQEKSPKSGHTKGYKTDYTVKGMNGKEAYAKTVEILSKYGLQDGVDYKLLDEYSNPSAKATGGHMDFALKPEGQAKIAQVMALEQMAGKSVAKASTPATAANSYYDYGYVAPTATSTVKTPSVPTMPPPPPPPKIAAPPEPPKQSPVASQHATTLTGMLGEVGRDVSDRTIAHIVTGGIGQRN